MIEHWSTKFPLSTQLRLFNTRIMWVCINIVSADHNENRSGSRVQSAYALIDWFTRCLPSAGVNSTSKYKHIIVLCNHPRLDLCGQQRLFHQGLAGPGGRSSSASSNRKETRFRAHERIVAIEYNEWCAWSNNTWKRGVDENTWFTSVIGRTAQFDDIRYSEVEKKNASPVDDSSYMWPQLERTLDS